MSRSFRFAAIVLALVAAPATLAVSAGSAVGSSLRPAEPLPVAAPVTVAAERAALATGPQADTNIHEKPAPPVKTTLPAARPVKTTSERIALATGPQADTNVREVAGHFSMVGLTWSGAAPQRVEIRWRNDGAAWSAWHELEAQPASKDTGAVPNTSEPTWTGPANRVQVRATRGDAPVTDELSVVTVDPGTSPNDAKIGQLATTSGSGVPTVPPVVTRAQRGADESIMTWPPEHAATTKAVAIHHTAGSNDYSCAESAAIVRGTYRYHSITNGWGDIGYNVLVDKCGTVFEGRTGGLNLPTIGAHTGGFNRFVFGISMIGSYGDVAPPAPALDSVTRWAAWKLSNGYTDSTADVTLISTGGGTSKYPAGTPVTLPTIFAHRDVGNTECPGNQGYASLGAIRGRVVELAGDWRSSPIYQKWQALGGANVTGPVFGGESDAAGGGRVTQFESSVITWRADVGAHWVTGAIYNRYGAMGGMSGRLGYPTSDPRAVPGGQRSVFEHGYIFWNSSTGRITVGITVPIGGFGATSPVPGR